MMWVTTSSEMSFAGTYTDRHAIMSAMKRSPRASCSLPTPPDRILDALDMASAQSLDFTAELEVAPNG